eukprot:5927166-Pleurochrysis_carterae.AAC.1
MLWPSSTVFINRTQFTRLHPSVLLSIWLYSRFRPPRKRTRASARLAASAPAGASQLTTLSLPSESTDHFVISPEFLANVD